MRAKMYFSLVNFLFGLQNALYIMSDGSCYDLGYKFGVLAKLMNIAYLKED